MHYWIKEFILVLCLFALLYVIVNYKQVFSQGLRMVLLVLIALGTGYHILKLYEN